MGKIAKLLNKKKSTTSLSEELQPKQPEKVVVTNAHELENHNEKRSLHFACISYDRAMATCRWCLTEYRGKYDLGWGNRYTKYAYDSAECRDMDAKAKGWKAIAEEDEEDLASLS